MVSPARFTAWRAEVRAPTTVTVFPDGCVDILVISGQDGLQELVSTELDAAPRRVQLGPGIDENRGAPVKLPEVRGAIEVVVGNSASCALVDGGGEPRSRRSTPWGRCGTNRMGTASTRLRG